MLAHRLFPLATLNDFCGEMDRVFGTIRDNGYAPAARFRNLPPVNISQDEKNVYVEIEVPGLTMENLEVEVIDNKLTIKGSHEQVSEENRTYHRRERSNEEFTRRFNLNTEVVSQDIEAVLKNGVLIVTLPKRPEVQPKRIEVKTG